NFEEVGLGEDRGGELVDVIGLVGVVGNQRIERRLEAVGAVLGRQHRYPRSVVGRQEIHQPAHLQQRLEVVLVSPIGDRRLGGVYLGAAQLIDADGFVVAGVHHVAGRV